MNYFILLDDKFANGLIDEIESVSLPGSNKYFIRGSISNKLHVDHPKAEWLADPVSDSLLKIFSQLNDNDQLFIDWYDLFIGKLVLTITADIPVNILMMGGDFYGEPLLIHDKNLYDSHTLRYVTRSTLFPKVWARRPVVLFRQFWEIWQKKKRAKKDFLLKSKTVQRINSICVNRFATSEIAAVKKMYAAENIQHRYFSFNQNFDAAQTLKVKKKEGNTLTIQVGNSATETNNHLDILPVLRRFLSNDIKITLPLAYGKEGYAAVVKDKASKLLKDKVSFKDNFVGREEYIKDLNDVDICIMYHNRSQALGNCVTLLALGKKLFLKKHNPLYHMFLRMGVVVFDAEKIGTMSFETFKMPLSEAQVLTNIGNLSGCFSNKIRIEELKELVN